MKFTLSIRVSVDGSDDETTTFEPMEVSEADGFKAGKIVYAGIEDIAAGLLSLSQGGVKIATHTTHGKDGDVVLDRDQAIAKAKALVQETIMAKLSRQGRLPKVDPSSVN